jgi:hypothetical protein
LESVVDVHFAALFGGERRRWDKGIVVIVSERWIRAIKLNGGSVQEVERIIILSPRDV